MGPWWVVKGRSAVPMNAGGCRTLLFSGAGMGEWEWAGERSVCQQRRSCTDCRQWILLVLRTLQDAVDGKWLIFDQHGAETVG